MRALGPADPVALRGDHPVRPGGRQVVQVVQQLLRVVGDLEVPLGQLALGHLGAAALAAAVDDLLVGQDGLVVRAPVDRAVLAVGQAALAEPQEQPLGPAVVLRVGGVEPPRPVDRDAVLLEGGELGVDVGVGVRRGVLVVADRGVLRVQAERVPAHRVQHLVAALPPVPGHHVVQRRDLGVAHVQVTARVGEHRQRVALLPRAVVVGAELVQLLPHRQPLGLGGVDVVRRGLVLVLLVHGGLSHVCGRIRSTKKPLGNEGQPRRGVRTDAAR